MIQLRASSALGTPGKGCASVRQPLMRFKWNAHNLRKREWIERRPLPAAVDSSKHNMLSKLTYRFNWVTVTRKRKYRRVGPEPLGTGRRHRLSHRCTE